MEDGKYILSYPGSGRTWLFGLLGKALELHFGLDLPPVSNLRFQLLGLHRADPRIPTLIVSHDDYPYLATIERTMIPKRRFAPYDVLFVCRDPRDTVVCCYFKHARRARMYKFPEFGGTISEFIRHEQYGIAGIVAYLNNWSEQRDVPRSFTTIRYEDVHADPGRELRRALAAIGVPGVKAGTIREAVEFTRFDNLHELEGQSALGMRALHVADASDPESYHFRRGIVGGFRDYLDDADVVYANRFLRELDPMYGYGEDT